MDDIDIFIEEHRPRLLALCKVTREHARKTGGPVDAFDKLDDETLMRILVEQLGLIEHEKGRIH